MADKRQQWLTDLFLANISESDRDRGRLLQGPGSLISFPLASRILRGGRDLTFDLIKRGMCLLGILYRSRGWIKSTLLGGSSFARFCQQEFGEFPRLVGRYCSYLLPKQAGGTPQILVDKTWRMTSRAAQECIQANNGLRPRGCGWVTRPPSCHYYIRCPTPIQNRFWWLFLKLNSINR